MESQENIKGQRKVSKNKNPQEKEEFRIAFGFPLGPRLGFGLTFSQLWTSNSEGNWSHRGKHHKSVKIRVESRIQYLEHEGYSGDRICRSYNIQPGSWKIPTLCTSSPGMFPSCSS